MSFKQIIAAMLCVFITTSSTAQFNNAADGNDNIISFSAIEINEGGVGSGLSWEHFLLKDKWLSFIVPVSVAIKPESNNAMEQMFYATPGIKLYTNMKSYQKLKFSIGPSILLGAGRGYQNNYYGPYYPGLQSRFVYGFMVTGGMNFFPSTHFYLGADLGFGATSLNLYDGVNTNSKALAHLSFKIGYRFSTRPKMTITEQQ